MIRLTAFIGLILLCFTASAQKQLKRYVSNQLQVIDSINPSATTYQDLKPIGDAIGDARIVMLGEVDHGDAPTFLAKTRLIQYLIQEKGFTVVAFESDFFGLNNGMETNSHNWDATYGFLRGTIFGIWGLVKECQPLLRYLATGITNGNVYVTGFDNQHHSSYTHAVYIGELLKFIDSSQLLGKGTQEEKAFAQLWQAYVPFFKNGAKVAPDTLRQPLHSMLNELYEQAKTKYGAANFWVQELKSLIAESYMPALYAAGPRGRWKGFSIRDKQMSDNLQWLATYKYPGSKIIVWAANGHIARKKITRPFGNKDPHVMGAYLTENPTFDSSTYVLGFTSSQGTAGRLGSIQYDIAPPKKNAFETWVSGGHPYAFLDFKIFKEKNRNYHRRYFMKGSYFHRDIKADWTHIFDGVFYIKDMYPTRR